MVVSEHSLSEHTVVETFVGRFDQHARQDFKWRIDHAITQGYRFVLLNMVAVSFIDSAALGWLVLAPHKCFHQRMFTQPTLGYHHTPPLFG